MAKREFDPIKCYKVIDTATGLESARYQLWANETGFNFFMDCNVRDGNNELVKYPTLADLPALGATEVLVDCEIDVEKIELCETFFNADGTVASKTLFIRWFAVSVDGTTGTIAPIVVDTELDGVTTYTVIDVANVGECPDVKTYVSAFVADSWPTGWGTVTIPAASLVEFTITSMNVDSTEDPQGYTIVYDGVTQTVSDACACKAQEFDAQNGACYFENGDAVITAGADSVICVTGTQIS